MTTALRLLQAGLTHAAGRLEQWQRDEAIRAAKLLDAAARSAEPSMREVFLVSLRKLRQAVQEADLAAVLESGGSAEHLIDLIPWDSVTARPLRAAWQAILLNLVAEATAIAADALPTAITAQLQEGGGQRAADWARNHAAQLVQAVTTGQQLAIRDTIGRVFYGEDADRLTPAQAAKVIRSTVGLTAKQAQAVTNFRSELVEEGLPTAKVETGAGRYAEKLRNYRAEMIARTETVAASMQGQQAQWAEAAAEGLIAPAEVTRVWYVTEDDRLDQIVCAPMEGQRTTLAGFFTTGDGRQLALPPAHPGCLTGDAFILTGDGITATTQRWYQGDILILRTARGHELRCTPNHPILSPLGWIAAERLHEVGYVIASLGMQRMTTSVDHYGNHVPTRIQQIAETFRISGSMIPARVPVAAEDFHGDGRGSKIAVIRTNRMLRHRFNPARAEFQSQVPFEMRDTRPQMLSALRPQALLGRSLRSPGRRPMCRRDLSEPSHRRCDLRPLDEFRLGLSPQEYSGSFQYSINDTTADAIVASELIDGSAGQVVADQIVDIRRIPFRGHVFNLETAQSWYVAEGIVTHNCRCTVILDLP